MFTIASCLHMRINKLKNLGRFATTSNLTYLSQLGRARVIDNVIASFSNQSAKMYKSVFAIQILCYIVKFLTAQISF